MYFQCLRRGDVVFGQVTAVQESGIIVTILAIDQGWASQVDGLKITVGTFHVAIILIFQKYNHGFIFINIIYYIPVPNAGIWTIA